MSDTSALAASVAQLVTLTNVKLSTIEGAVSSSAQNAVDAAAAISAVTAQAAAAAASRLGIDSRIWPGTYSDPNPTVRPAAAGGGAIGDSDEFQLTAAAGGGRRVRVSGVWTSPNASATDVALVKAVADAVPGGLGDYTVDGQLIIMSGDSTTEQFGGSGFGSDRITIRRQAGEKFEKIAGLINFGGSGHQLASWVDGALGSVPVYTNSNLGVSQNDYYGHKAIGATSLATQLAWRAAKVARATWAICYGINDCILNAAVGNLALGDLTAFVEGYLHTAITRILTAFPQDRIVLRIPNPMTARPYSQTQFPAQSAYPTFGQNDATDQALVEKWNQALYAAYVNVSNRHPSTALLDTWALVFGKSNTTLSVSQLPNMGDLVHPGGNGYIGIAENLVTLLAGRFRGNATRQAEADARAVALSVNPWDVYPGYFRDNARYKLLAECAMSSVGSNYLDLGIPYAQFIRQISGPIYVVVGDRVAQYFATYTPGASGANTRLLSVAPTTALQAAGQAQTVQIFAETAIKLISGDSFVHNLAVVAKEYIEANNIGSAGTNYIDISLPATAGRISTKFLAGVGAGTLVVGGTVQTTLALTGATVSRNGTTSQRILRIGITGSYASYVGQPAAITFADDKPSPKLFERIPVQSAVVPHAVGNKGFVYNELPMVDGATMAVQMPNLLATPAVVDVSSLLSPNRTLIGTITVPANAGTATMATGNPTSVIAGSAYEFVITSSTTTVGPLICTMTPV